MDLNTQIYPFAYYKGKLITFNQADEFTVSYFGGPGDLQVGGTKHGPRKIHHIATLNYTDLNADYFDFGSSLPFYYGMCFDGCELEYFYTDSSKLKITDMEPTKSNDDWPYEGFPNHLPYFPLYVNEIKSISEKEALDKFSQYVDTISDVELIFIVPPNPKLGVSMWGPTGDAEGVKLVFVYNIKSKKMRVHNVCS